MNTSPILNPEQTALARRGVYLAIGTHTIWGLFPLYFKAVSEVNPPEIIVHRVLWSVLFVALILIWQRGRTGFPEFTALLRRPGALKTLTATTALIATNWLIFVWAVNDNRVLETSLGYFITPLVSIFLGGLVLGERLRPVQKVAVALALAGVANKVFQLGTLPWVSVSLALTFASYGLLRKKLSVDPVMGLFVETLIATPLALLYFTWLWQTGGLAFGHLSLSTDLLLMMAGPMTAIPLILFAAATRYLRLATLGFLQYITPSITLFLAIFVFDEPFGSAQFTTFALIWAGLVLYSWDSWRRSQR